MKTLNEDMDPLFQRHGDRSHRDEFLQPLGTVSSWESMKKDTQTQVNENPRASMKTGWFEIVLLSFAGNSSKIIDHQFDGNWWMAPTSSSEVVANKVTLAPCIDDFGSSLCWRGHVFFEMSPASIDLHHLWLNKKLACFWNDFDQSQVENQDFGLPHSHRFTFREPSRLAHEGNSE